MTTSKLSTAILITTFIFLFACKKEDFSVNNNPRVDPSKVMYTPKTSDELLLVENLSKTTDIFKELYKSKKNIQFVNIAIASKTYTDESILLHDLIFPQKSKLQANKAFQNNIKSLQLDINSFGNDFMTQARKLNDAKYNEFLQKIERSISPTLNSNSYSTGEQVTVYFPYSEEFIDPNSGNGGTTTYGTITSLVTATADADEGIGSLPTYVNGILQGYTQVLVNDEYAAANPTHIIGVNGVELYDNGLGTSGTTLFRPEPPIDIPNLSREVKQVYVGKVQCKHQFDHFISIRGNGGGSEIRFTRADGFLKVADGQVQADVFIIGDNMSISRRSIFNKVFVTYDTEWDGDWESSNLEQNLAIFENDTRGDLELSGEISTKLKLGLFDFTIKPIAYKITLKSEDPIQKQTNYKHDVFFTLNRTNIENMLIDGWPVRDKNARVSFTLMDRTFY
jgi:hypothetical protein